VVIRNVPILKVLCLIATTSVLTAWSPIARAGNQQYEPLAASIRTALTNAVAEQAPNAYPHKNIQERLAYLKWVGIQSERLAQRKRDFAARKRFLEIVYYEANRAGLDPELILALIQVESNFRQHAISSAGARGYTQVMPFWVDLIGDGDKRKLFDAKINIRFGCVILRHYIDIEAGNLFRALGRYNGSLGKAEYPNMVINTWKRWKTAEVAPL